jgi:O-antigen/teichoic acid export membrane protein
MPQMVQAPHSLRKSIVWNTGSQVMGRAISAITTLGITILIARRYGTDGYGDFIKITTFVSFFYLLADFGFNAIFLQKSALPDRSGTVAQDSQWSDLLGLRLVVSFVLIFLALALLVFIPHGVSGGYTSFVRLGIVFFVPTILFQALTTTANALFQKHFRYDIATLSVAIGSMISLALVWVFTTISVSSSVLFGIIGLSIGSAVTAFIGILSSRKFVERIQLSLSPSRLSLLFVASIPLGLTLLFNLVYVHIDSVILTLTRSTSEVGIYGLAYKIFELPLVLPTFFMNALYPFMLGKSTTSTGIASAEFKLLFQRSLGYMIAASFIMMGVIWFAAPLITYIKEDFVAGIPVLRVLSLGLPFFFISSLTMWTLITAKKQTMLAYIYGISMIGNVLLNMWLTPIYGYMAAAWITVVSEALVLLLSGIVLRRLIF